MAQTQRFDVLKGAIALMHDQLAVTSSDSVVITADTVTDRDVIEAVMLAAQQAGAKVCVITIPQLPFQGALADPFVPDSLGAAVANCTVWVDLTLPYLAGAGIFDAALKTGNVRYSMSIGMDAGGLANLYGRVDLDQLYEVQSKLEALVTVARNEGLVCRVVTAAGTDLSFKLKEPSFSKPRRATKGGIYSVPGNLFMVPDIDTVKGQVVLEAVYHEYYAKLDAPITITVDGAIRSIDGAGIDRRIMERALRRACGGDLGYVIHVTHAFNPAARYRGTNLLEDVRATGNDAIGFGRPWWEPGGGENHPDGVISRQSFWIGNVQIAEDGVFVGDFAEYEEKLQPVYF